MSRPISSESPFRAVADPTRRRIMQLLLKRELAAHEIAAHFSATWPTISAHLRILQVSGMVSHRRKARQRIYSLSTRSLRPIVEWLAQFQPGAGTERRRV